MNPLDTSIMRTFMIGTSEVWLDIHLFHWDAEKKFLTDEGYIELLRANVVSQDLGDTGRYDVYGLTEKGEELISFTKL